MCDFVRLAFYIAFVNRMFYICVRQNIIVALLHPTPQAVQGTRAVTYIRTAHALRRPPARCGLGHARKMRQKTYHIRVT